MNIGNQRISLRNVQKNRALQELLQVYIDQTKKATELSFFE